jgi:flagellar biosynthetic protein FliR
LSAAAQSFELVPVGRIVLSPDVIYTSLIQFIVQMFMIGFRIAMPVFLGATMLNVILGVLAKSSPQMNMFAIGMQLKVFVGLFLLAVCIMFVPNIANYIMERMRDMIQTILGGL